MNWKSTKFVICMVGVVGLLAAAFAGKFSGDLGLYVGGICTAYVGGNALITRSVLANGKTS